jgi:hypothetical protein
MQEHDNEDDHDDQLHYNRQFDHETVGGPFRLLPFALCGATMGHAAGGRPSLANEGREAPSAHLKRPSLLGCRPVHLPSREEDPGQLEQLARGGHQGDLLAASSGEREVTPAQGPGQAHRDVCGLDKARRAWGEPARVMRP